MKSIQISDDELQLYFNYLMKDNGVQDIQDFSILILEDNPQYIDEELTLEVN